MSNTVKVGHIADVHLRIQQYGYRIRGQHFFSAFMNAITALCDAGADLILCSGDLFDTTTPSSSIVIDQMAKADELLKQRGVLMFVSPGNHDSNTPHWSRACRNTYGACSAGVVSVGDRGREPEQFYCKGLSIAALPWLPPDEMKAAMAAAEEADILMWHGEIKEFCGYPKPNTIEVNDFPKKWQLIAMGDQHVHRSITREDGLVIAYPGSTEMCSESEEEEKSAWLHVFENGVYSHAESVPFETVPKCKLLLNKPEDLDRATDKIKEGSVVYCHFNRELKDVRATLLRALKVVDKEVAIIHMLPFSSSKQETKLVTLEENRNRILTPQAFIAEKAPEYFGENPDRALVDLSIELLTPGMQAKDSIDKYCMSKL